MYIQNNKYLGEWGTNILIIIQIQLVELIVSSVGKLHRHLASINKICNNIDGITLTPLALHRLYLYLTPAYNSNQCQMDEHIRARGLFGIHEDTPQA